MYCTIPFLPNRIKLRGQERDKRTLGLPSGRGIILSDENTAAPAATAQAPSATEQMIPKARLDELIAQRNEQARETQFLQQTLNQLIQNQRAQMKPEVDPEMEELKTTNPAIYQKLMKQEMETRQVRAGLSSALDQQDKLVFLQETGADGKKKLAEVERILSEERKRGNFQANRFGVYTWMLGQEKLREDALKAQAPKTVAKAAEPVTETEAPTSDYREATTIAGGTTPSSKAVKTREDRIKELENIEF